MVSYNKKPNHVLLKEIQSCTTEHEKIKEEIFNKLKEIEILENNLISIEEKYKEIYEILSERL